MKDQINCQINSEGLIEELIKVRQLDQNLVGFSRNKILTLALKEFFEKRGIKSKITVRNERGAVVWLEQCFM